MTLTKTSRHFDVDHSSINEHQVVARGMLIIGWWLWKGANFVACPGWVKEAFAWGEAPLRLLMSDCGGGLNGEVQT